MSKKQWLQKGDKKMHHTHFLSVPLESWGKASKACLKLELQGKQKYTYSIGTSLSIQFLSINSMEICYIYPFLFQ